MKHNGIQSVFRQTNKIVSKDCQVPELSPNGVFYKCIVTLMLLKLNNTSQVYGGNITWTLKQAIKVLMISYFPVLFVCS